MSKFGIIILNYLSYNESIDCVNSFKKYLGKNEVHIVIVDNCSPNESFDILSKIYKNDKIVDVIQLNKNEGFARGNNAGCKWIREKYKCDFYIFSNSDIIIQNDIFSWINKKYREFSFDLLGPDIYAQKLQIHQNPIKPYTTNHFIINVKLTKKYLDILLTNICRVFKLYIPMHYSSIGINHIDELNKNYFNVPLHGSFIISSDRYFDFYEDFFNPNTFLYMEEYLLFQRCKSKNMTTIVSLDFQVIHLQGVSTDKVDASIYNKRINRMKNEIASLKLYKNEISKEAK